VIVTQHDSLSAVHLLRKESIAGDIGASIVLSLPTPVTGGRAAVAFILYAQTPGAFVDLAAAWRG
jgi:hypothetical protein